MSEIDWVSVAMALGLCYVAVLIVVVVMVARVSASYENHIDGG